MNNVWTILKIVAPAVIAYLISRYLEGQPERVAVLIVGVVLSLIQFINDSAVKQYVCKEISQIKGRMANLKRQHHSHIADPHIIASATIKTDGAISIENGFNVRSVTDVSSNEVHLNIDNPSGKSVIPTITPDSGHVFVTATPTTIKVSWDESCPNTIYMTAIYGD